MSDNMFKGCEDGMAGTISGFSDGCAVGEIIGSSNVADITRLPVVIQVTPDLERQTIPLN